MNGITETSKPLTAPAPAVSLAYALVPRRSRAWRFVLPTALGVFGLVAFTAGWWLEPAWHRARVLYYQRRCADYSPATDEVLYESEPARARALLGTPDYVAVPYFQRLVAARKAPAAWVEYCRLIGRSPTTQANAGVTAILFLHERRNSKGGPRIVVVELTPGSWAHTMVEVVTPAGLRGLPASRGATARGTFLGFTDPYNHSLQIFAGQPDPADASRFTIPYKLDGQDGKVKGRLMDDDTVTLEYLQ